ncbi:MAG: hypothetical protein IPJ95_00245 [Gemmatimonadetes bacterium]|nr:hypothetical protein [Gemmatimonadota bacterium]
MTSYTLIAPPTSLRFREMEPKELERYFAWFLASIPERIEVLSTHVRSSEPFSSWIPDRSPESLGALGEWFTHTVTLRQRTTEEIQGIYAKGPDWFTQVEVPGEELTEETFSLAMDIGMYLGEILRQSATRLQWKALKGNKQEADYGQPILQPFKGDWFATLCGWPLHWRTDWPMVRTRGHGFVSFTRLGEPGPSSDLVANLRQSPAPVAGLLASVNLQRELSRGGALSGGLRSRPRRA